MLYVYICSIRVAQKGEFVDVMLCMFAVCVCIRVAQEGEFVDVWVVSVL